MQTSLTRERKPRDKTSVLNVDIYNILCVYVCVFICFHYTKKINTQSEKYLSFYASSEYFISQYRLRSLT